MRSLRAELIILLLAIAIIPLSLSLGVGWWQSRAILQQELSQNLRAIATRQAALINESVANVEQETEAFASSAQVVRSMAILTDKASDGATLEEARKELLADVSARLFNNRFNNLLLVDREGVLVFSAAPVSGVGERLVDTMPDSELTRMVDRAATILETGLSDLQPATTTGTAGAYAATPVFREGLLIGVLALEVNQANLLRGIDNYTGLGRTGETVVATLQGENAVVVAPIRSRPDAAFKLAVQMADNDRQPLLESLRGRRGAGLGLDHRGTEVFAVWRYIPSMRWGIVVKIDRARPSVPSTGLDGSSRHCWPSRWCW